MDTVSQSEEQKVYNERKQYNGYIYKNGNQRGRNKGGRKGQNHGNSNIKVCTGNPTESVKSPENTYGNYVHVNQVNKNGFKSKNISNASERKEIKLNESDKVMVYTNRIPVVEGFGNESSTCNNTAPSLHGEIASYINKPKINVQVHRGRGKNSSNFVRGMPLYSNEPNGGYRDNRNHSSYNVRFHRNGNKNFVTNQSEHNSSPWFQNSQRAKEFDRNPHVKHNNPRGNAGFQNNFNHSLYHNKTPGFEHVFKSTNNGSIAEVNSGPRVNKPQRTCIFKRSSKSVSTGNPLGMFWPQLSPLKEGETPTGSNNGGKVDVNTDEVQQCEKILFNAPSPKETDSTYIQKSKLPDVSIKDIHARTDLKNNDIGDVISYELKRTAPDLTNLVIVKRNGSEATVPSKEFKHVTHSNDNNQTGNNASLVVSNIESSEESVDCISNLTLNSDKNDSEFAQRGEVVPKDRKSSHNSLNYSAITAKHSTSSCNSSDAVIISSNNKSDHCNINSPEKSLDCIVKSVSAISSSDVGVSHQPNVLTDISCDRKKSLNQGNTTTNREKMNQENQFQPNESIIKEVEKIIGNSNPSKEKQGKVSDLRKSPSHNNQAKKKKPKKGPDFNTYCISLDLEESFDEQAKSMISQFEMTPKERARVEMLKADLYRVFSPIIPKVEPVLFGSVVAGTAFRNSDVDIYLKCFDSLPADNVREFIVSYGSTIHKGGYFRHGIKIPSARVPIVKAIHNATGKNVDISFVVENSKPHFGLCNSLLVKHLCSYDPKVRNLIMLVLFWAKCHGFVGKYQMSSFSFILMTIFYLQIVEILPPLNKLIQVSENSSCWPNTFNSDSRLLTNNNKESLESLYLGFFTFYSAVRFNEVVISPYAGELVLGALFESMEMLPECYSGYRRLVQAGNESPLVRSDMCIQEPFNMSWNTVRSVNPKIIELLKQGCHNVCNVFAKFFSNRALSVVHSRYQHAEGEEDSYSWEIPCPPDRDSFDWFKQVLKCTQTIFNSILLMELKDGTSDSEEYDNSNFCKFYLSNGGEENPVKQIVSSDYMIAVKERSKVVKAYQSKYISEFEKEVKASSLLMDILKKKDKKCRFSAVLYIARNEKNGSTEVTINKCSKHSKLKKTEHTQFVSYLKNENFKHFVNLTLQRDQSEKQVETGSSKSED